MQTRRTFLQTVPALAALPALAEDPKKPPAKDEGLTLGFSLYGMKTLKTGDALMRLNAIGYDSVEFCLNPGWDAAPDKLTAQRRRALRALLGHFELTLTALMVNCSLAGNQKPHHEKLKQAAQVAHDLAPDAPPLIETVMGNGKWDAVKNQVRDHLGAWAEIAKKSKTLLCVKPHRFGACNLPEHAVWLVEQIKSPSLKLAYDYSHFAHRDLSLEKTIQLMMPHTRFIHVKDTVLRDGKPRFVLPGESGQIDYRKLLRLAHKAGYRGDINVEVSGQVWGQPNYNPIAAALKSYRHLAPTFDQ